jgi:hypothetical protein
VAQPAPSPEILSAAATGVAALRKGAITPYSYLFAVRRRFG